MLGGVRMCIHVDEGHGSVLGGHGPQDGVADQVVAAHRQGDAVFGEQAL